MSRNDKVLVVSERWWPDGTGAVLSSHLIAKILQSAGFKLTIVHGTKKPTKIDGINYVYTDLLSVRNKHKLWMNCYILSKMNWFHKALQESDVLYIPRYCYPIIPIAKKLNKQVVVHLHDYQPVSYNSIVISEPKKHNDAFREANVVEFEILEHGSAMRSLLAALTSPINGLCGVWLRRADTIICVSKRQAEIISRLAPKLASKLRIIYNPIPDAPFIRKNISDQVFLYLGGDSYVKGFHILLDASRKIMKKRYSTKFLIAGIFNKRDSLKIINILNKKYGGAYHVLGYVRHSELLKLHAISHALLFPSICEEPFPYAVIESMIIGTLPVASKIGGIPEIVNGTIAERFTFTPGSAIELSERIEKVLSMTSEQLIDIGLSLRESVLRKFNPETTKNKVVRAFTQP